MNLGLLEMQIHPLYFYKKWEPQDLWTKGVIFWKKCKETGKICDILTNAHLIREKEETKCIKSLKTFKKPDPSKFNAISYKNRMHEMSSNNMRHHVDGLLNMYIYVKQLYTDSRQNQLYVQSACIKERISSW